MPISALPTNPQHPANADLQAIVEARLRLAMDAARLGSFEWDLVSNVVTWSPAIEQMHGIPVGSFDGTFESYARDIHPDDVGQVLSTVQQSVANAAQHQLSYRIIRPDGETRWLEAHGQYEKDASGRPLRLIGVCRDVTEERVAQQELRESVEHAKQLAEEAHRARSRTERLQRLVERLASMMSTDEVARVFVEQVQDAMGVDMAWVGLHDRIKGEIYTIAHSGYPAGHVNNWMRFSATLRVPATLCLEDGTPRYFRNAQEMAAEFPALPVDRAPPREAIAVLPLDVGEGPFGVVTLAFADAHDFTDDEKALALTLSRQFAQALERARLYEAERIARREAVEANRAKSEFLARMSHDLRTPLNAIGGYTQLLELGIHGEVTAAQLDALARIRRAQEHLLTLINDILGFARVEAGQVRLELTAVPLDETLRSVVELIEPQARARSLDFAYGSPGVETNVHADRERLVQVLLNLLTNALKFTNAPGSVTLDWNVDGEHVQIRVRDTGRGIPRERLEAIFDPFVQETRLTNDNVAGVGLGLAISRDLAQKMHAELSVESQLGEGSVFILTMKRLD